MGLNGTQSYEEAVKWFKRAAEAGHAKAQANLGLCLFYGQGVERDVKQAIGWFVKAAEQGNAGAQAKLGDCYFHGEGIEQD